MKNTLEERRERLMPKGIPRYIRCYDAPAFGDRYTVVYTKKSENRWFNYRGMSTYPCSPGGIGMHDQSENNPVDCPKGARPPAIGCKNHLGTRIAFVDLPEDCRKLVIDDYEDLWDLKTVKDKEHEKQIRKS